MTPKRSNIGQRRTYIELHVRYYHLGVSVGARFLIPLDTLAQMMVCGAQSPLEESPRYLTNIHQEDLFLP